MTDLQGIVPAFRHHAWIPLRPPEFYDEHRIGDGARARQTEAQNPSRSGSQLTRRWREMDSNPRSPFLDTHLLNALALGAAGLAYVSYEQLCCYAGGESRLSR
jgi:hypothetical protein